MTAVYQSKSRDGFHSRKSGITGTAMHPAPRIEPLRVQKQNTLKTWVLKNFLNNGDSSLCNTARLPLFSDARKKKSRPWAGILPEKIETPRRRESFKKCDLVTREIQATNYKQPN